MSSINKPLFDIDKMGKISLSMKPRDLAENKKEE